jgi:hypothetical protein
LLCTSSSSSSFRVSLMEMFEARAGEDVVSCTRARNQKSRPLQGARAQPPHTPSSNSHR